MPSSSCMKSEELINQLSRHGRSNKGGQVFSLAFFLEGRRLDFVDAADMVVVLMPLQITPLRARRHGHY
jgi:hypothetical protein